METNFFGVLALTRALLPTFRAQRHGRIVLVSSQSAFAGQPGNSMYCASKWALEGWAESLAYEVDPFGIESGHRAWPLSHRDLEQHDWVKPSHSAYLPWLKQLQHAADRHQAKTSGDPKEVAVMIARRLKRAVRASAIGSAPSPSWTISCAARCRRSSSAEARRAISGCRWRGGRSGERAHPSPSTPPRKARVLA